MNKKILTLALFVSMNLMVFAQQKYQWSEVVVEKTQQGTYHLLKNELELLQGDYTLVRKDKSYEKIHFVDGKKEGAYTEYSPQGYRMREGNYKNGKKDGLWRFFDENNGTLYAEITFKEDKKNGLFREYNTAGIIVNEGNFIDDLKHGVWKDFDNIGQLQKTQMFHNGKVVTDKL